MTERRAPYTVGLATLGCKVSQYETEAIGEAFERAGFAVRPFESVCDVYVINTCTVTAESDRKSRQVIRRAVGKNSRAVVCVCGCFSQVDPEAVAAIPGVSVVLGTKDKLSVVDLALRRLSERGGAPVVSVSDVQGACFENMTITRAPRTRAYVKIEDGCECRCAYCAIPGARGTVRSKRPEDVIAEVEALYRSGTREIVLTGIETASYGRDLSDGYGLGDLLCDLDRRHSAERIRLGSLSPELMKPDFICRIRDLSILAPHFHLSMQSGSDSVLRGMRRRYNTDMALRALADLRRAIPGVQFTTDLMVGFPGEGEREFEETLAFIRQARFLDMHVFAYSRRPGTPAASFDGQVPESVKHERSAAVIALKNAIRDDILDGIVREGRPLSVVFETDGTEGSVGHSAEFIEVRAIGTSPLHGQIREVAPLSHKDGVVLGNLV